MRMRGRCLAATAALTGLLASTAWALSAPSALVLDSDSGRELVSEGADAPRSPASTAKLMTALLACERLDPDALLRVSPRAAGMPRTKADLRAGERYRVRDLIRALLVGSSNDAAVVLAEGVSGSEERFAELMTRRAKALGCRKTRFLNASGLTAPGQVSTCRDLLRIFGAVRASRALMSALTSPSATVEHPGGGRTVMRNHNHLLGDYESAPVGKTGYTRAARHCFVGAFVSEGREYRVACMGSGRLWEDLKVLTTGSSPKAPAASAWPSERLRAVQRALAKLGYRSLARFQKEQHLLADGEPRDATCKALSRKAGIPIP